MTLYACQPGNEAKNGDNQNGLFTESLLSAFKSLSKKKKMKNESPRFYNLVTEAGEIMKVQEQMPSVEIPNLGPNIIDLCVDGTLSTDWYE
mmetsp:Transcript_29474/g.47279  ORF Transcript_29474/g.47279 Transcript_29474/m.47279 type:complete len:91 (+) Transcript_29474:702-974(+)